MENHEKLRILEADVLFLEEELDGKRRLLEALHPAVSFPQCQDLQEQIESINRSIGYKRANIDEITQLMKKH